MHNNCPCIGWWAFLSSSENVSQIHQYCPPCWSTWLESNHSFHIAVSSFILWQLWMSTWGLSSGRRAVELMTVSFSNKIHGSPRNGACYWVTQALNSQCSGCLGGEPQLCLRVLFVSISSWPGANLVFCFCGTLPQQYQSHLVDRSVCPGLHGLIICLGVWSLGLSMAPVIVEKPSFLLCFMNNQMKRLRDIWKS